MRRSDHLPVGPMLRDLCQVLNELQLTHWS